MLEVESCTHIKIWWRLRDLLRGIFDRRFTFPVTESSHRLYTLLSTLHNLPKLPTAQAGDGNTIELTGADICIPSIDGSYEDGTTEAVRKEATGPVSGGPSTLVRALSVRLHCGMHLMITGSNGVGKTAVARVLAGLWAPRGPLASVTRPSSSGAGDDDESDQGQSRPGVFVVPQRAYMVSGSLLEQVIYPQSSGNFYAEGGDASELQAILEVAHLGYLVQREGGWGTVKEWRDVLSGGEKQRVCISSESASAK